jgi:GNAT superfamily N-acetyltransferase
VDVVLIPNDEGMWRQAAQWCLGEWNDVWPEDSVDTYWDHYRSTASDPQHLPLVLAALESGKLIGVITLIDDDELPGATESPWLAACYVEPGHRGRGVGRLLVGECEALARSMGFQRLHLFTWNEQQWYMDQGWQVLREVDLRGRRTAVMAKVLEIA